MSAQKRFVNCIPSWGWLLAIIVLAFTLRIWGIGNGLPYSQMPEESADMSSSLQMAAGSSPRYAFHRVGWPISQLPIHGLHYLFLYVNDLNFSLANFEERYFTHRGEFLLSVRLYLATLMAASLIFVYFTARVLANSNTAGLLAAFILSVQPWHVYMSYIAWPDGYALVWIAVALVAAVYIAKTGNRWAYILGGIAAAATILARLQAITIIVPVALAHLVFWWRQPGRPVSLLLIRWLWSFGAFVVAGILFNPFIILTPSAASADSQFIFGLRYGTQTELSQYAWSIARNLPMPVGVLRPYVAIPALASIIYVGWRRDLNALLIVAFGIVFVASLLPASWLENHFWLPAIIPSTIIIGYSVVKIVQRSPRWLSWATIGCYILVICLGFTESVVLAHIYGKTDTRMLAYNWILDNIPSGSNIMIGETEIYNVPLARTRESILRVQEFEGLSPSLQFELEHPEQVHQPTYNLFGPEYKEQIMDDDKWWAFVTAHDVEYVIEADYCFMEHGYQYDMPSKIQFPVITPPIREKLVLLNTFSPFSTGICQQSIPEGRYLTNMRLKGWDRVGPVIRIYRVPADIIGDPTE